MQEQTKICQNCKEKFIIEPEDFEFYDKIQVPSPTFCPECRFQRRLMFFNGYTLYNRNCNLCGKSIISNFSSDNPHKVYCEPCWWGDKWDAIDYGIDYNFNRNFFEQFEELKMKVPMPALTNDYLFNINSKYVNYTGNLKNCYLLFNADTSENTLYSAIAVNVKDSMDIFNSEKLELCYQDTFCNRCYNTFFSQNCNDCIDVYFSKNLTNCEHCFGCVNLKYK